MESFPERSGREGREKVEVPWIRHPVQSGKCCGNGGSHWGFEPSRKAATPGCLRWVPEMGGLEADAETENLEKNECGENYVLLKRLMSTLAFECFGSGVHKGVKRLRENLR